MTHIEKDFFEIMNLQKRYVGKNLELKGLLDEYEGLSKAKGEAERDYLKLFEQATLSLKAEGQSVTIIKDIAKGRTADARMAFVIAESMHDVIRARIKACHANIDTYRTLISTQKAIVNIR